MIHWVSKCDDSKNVKENSVVTLTKHQPVQLVLLNGYAQAAAQNFLYLHNIKVCLFTLACS